MGGGGGGERFSFFFSFPSRCCRPFFWGGGKNSRPTQRNTLEQKNRYSGPDGVYTHTFAHERDPHCPVCSPGVSLECARGATLRDVIAAIKAHPSMGPRAAHPSVSHGSENLYVRGALEELTRGNLDKGMRELLLGSAGAGGGGGGATDDGARVSATLTVNDKQLAAPMRVRLTLCG